MNIEANIQEFIWGNSKTAGIKPNERYASFDYCFNYFQSFREQGIVDELASSKYIQESCLQLGFYLASWGMLRGSSFLLQKSVRFLTPLIKVIASANPTLWEIDAHCYTSTNIDLIKDFKKTIVLTLGNGTDILVTKIMLGVFGNIPAFDNYFRKGLGVSTFGEAALKKISHFYNENRLIIEQHRRPTLDFATGQPTQRIYTRAKIIDMIFFVEGSKQ